MSGAVACMEGAAAVPEGAPVAPLSAAPAGVDGGEDAGSVVNLCDDAGNRGDGSTFTDLYRDFFGPTGLASCSSRSICHVPGGTGAMTSNYVCDPDKDGCWMGMTSSIVPGGGSLDPEHTTLYMALRKAPPLAGSGPMPRNSAFAFCPGDLDRIRAWIAAGAPND
jgi:hypothetical protein